MNSPYEEIAGQFLRHPIDVLGVYRTVLTPGGRYAGHKLQRTTKCAMLFALRGRAAFLFNDQPPIDMTPGTVVLGGYNASLEIVVDAAGFEYALIHYLPASDGPDAAGAAGRSPLLTSDVTVLHAELDSQTLQTLDKLLQLAALPGNIERLEKTTLFYSLLGRVLDYERSRHNGESGELIERALRFIHQHYMDDLTLESIAGHFRLRPKYFSYLFHKHTGIGPIHYLIRYRLNRAHELLLAGRSSVRDIARTVGYTDAYYFSRLFKKHKGMSPNEARSVGSGNNPS